MATWVLVANRTGARIFVRGGRKLGVVGQFDNPSGRRTDEDIEAGQPQRTFDRHGRGHDPRSSPHEHAAEAFARDLAAELRSGRTERHVDRIVLVAEPHFLGLLRHELDEATSRLVASSVAKDLVKCDAHELEPYVNDVLPL
ncbi:MAG TPA: host attachment protein [Polyangiaceae bacterium]